ncbi:hypothetical protein AbraIFM66951_001743 [Aspergillus brasiliensis]|uniref:Transcription factor domain-containing protein n=1 Tax=Aspergillus brasiliensis TaxID=319629 RepID=A0A9W5Z4U9_9EURO|nr:hypothetical protein AbraCBS73388_005168 [Aspergillus brasiliensis]GKZ49339.1 hypothetical protein AbraIFM66951_001743 [Aspergillus brasiliensis]
MGAKYVIWDPSIEKELTAGQALYDNQSTLGLLLPISKEFMLTIPSIIDNPYIQVDVRVLILYHGALNQGMLLSPDLSPSDKKEYSLFLYRTTLRLMEEWQLQDQANELSLHVAFWMSHEAYSQLDFDLSYRLHVCACEIARDLGILQLDSENPVPSSTSSEIFSRSPDNLRWPEDDMGKIHRDIHRIYFWHILITNDYSFQNHLYRLGSIDAGTWKVGLPDFSSSLSLSNINRDTEVYFQVSLRISLIEMKYSELVHGSPSCRSAGGFLDDAGHVKLRQLLLEIATVLSEWQVEQLLMQVTSKINAGFYAILIWRTTSMINSFLRTQPYSSKWPIEQDTILEHEAAHRSVKALQRLFALHVNEGDLFWMFGHLKCFFTPALGVLFGSILASTTEETAASDLSLLSRAQSIISSCANKRQELKSLELYIGTLNHLLRLALRRGFPSRLQPLTQPYWEEQRYNDRFCQSLRRDQYRSKPFESGNSSPGPLAPDLLHEDEIGLLHRCGITATELYHDPYREVLIMQKMLLTEPDPHRQWWAFETQT